MSGGDNLAGLDRYEIIKEICKTLQGKLHKGRDRITNEPVAIKEAFKVLVESGRSHQGSKVSEDFPKETRLHKKLSDLPGMPISILKAVDNFETSKSFFLVLEWAEGGEAFEYVKNSMSASAQGIASLRFQDQVPTPDATMNDWQRLAQHMFKQLIRGVAWLHVQNVTHRDLSLENMMLANEDDSRIKIMDFGVAKEHGDGEFLCEGARIGKTGYMAPEVHARREYDARAADVWCLGVILFMMLVGAPPYKVPRAGDQAFAMIYRGQLRTVLTYWKRMPMVTEHALDLMERIFQSQANRITMEEIWEHPYLQIAEPFPQVVGLEAKTAEIDIEPEQQPEPEQFIPDATEQPEPQQQEEEHQEEPAVPPPATAVETGDDGDSNGVVSAVTDVATAVVKKMSSEKVVEVKDASDTDSGEAEEHSSEYDGLLQTTSVVPRVAEAVNSKSSSTPNATNEGMVSCFPCLRKQTSQSGRPDSSSDKTVEAQ